MEAGDTILLRVRVRVLVLVLRIDKIYYTMIYYNMLIQIRKGHVHLQGAKWNQPCTQAGATERDPNP